MADNGQGAGGASDLPNVGDCIAGKYRVERLLGAGGMGAVLAAQHLVLGSRVAIKVLLPRAAQLPGAVERFLREARAAATLRGDHVARVLDTGVLDTGMPYLVMEYLSGRDLGKVLAERGPLPIGDAADYLLQACDAMAEAHALGVVHRDLKPANLFLATRPNGSSVLKVLDFGLAKILDGARTETPEASLTNTGLVIGTPHYMPPEQLRGLKFADARSDIWSLGVIAFEILTGKRPFVAPDTIGLITAIAADEPAPPSTLRPDLPAALEALILRCLRKSPETRPQSVQELAAVLEPFATGRGRGSLSSLVASDAAPMTAAPVEPTRDITTLTLGASEVHGPRGRRSSRGVWLAVGGIATLGALAVAIVVVAFRRGESASGEPAIVERPAQAASVAPGAGDAPALSSSSAAPSGTAASIAVGSPPTIVPGSASLPVSTGAPTAAPAAKPSGAPGASTSPTVPTRAAASASVTTTTRAAATTSAAPTAKPKRSLLGQD